MQDKKEVSVPGWRGTGYMVIDPVSGDGAFLIGGGGNGGWADIEERLKQPLYAIYWGFTHLDEVGALFFKNAIGKIASALDNILDVFDTTYKCGSILGLVSALMAGMIAIIAAYPIMIIYLLPLYAELQYILVAAIVYGAALVFNNINGNIQEHCKQ